METKRQKFLRLANARTNKIIETIRLLSNLSNKSNYDYDELDIDKIFKAIDKEVKIAKNEFRSNEDKKEKFTL